MQRFRRSPQARGDCNFHRTPDFEWGGHSGNNRQKCKADRRLPASGLAPAYEGVAVPRIASSMQVL